VVEPAAQAPAAGAVGGGSGGDELDTRPSIRLGVELHYVVDQATEALASRDPEIYQRDGALVRVVRVAEHEAAHERAATGTPQIRQLAAATLLERLTAAAIWLRPSKSQPGIWCQARPDPAVVGALATRCEWNGIRPLAGVAEAPGLRPDGTVFQSPGYDPATGYLYAPSCEFPPVPAAPTIEQARAAWTALLEPWREFPWRGQEDLAAQAAAVLTILARAAILGSVPGFPNDASTRGSGKTLAMDVICTIATGRETAKMPWPRDNDEELGKIIGSYALRGAAVLALDNVTGTFGGANLDALLTCRSKLAVRVLGESKTPELAWNGVVLAGGNNLVIAEDTARRLIRARMEPDREKPEERSGYAHYPLLPWVRKERPRLVVAALTVLRAFVVAGRPDVGIAGNGFEEWAALVASAVMLVSGIDLNQCRPSAGTADDDPDTSALRIVLAHWDRLAPGGTTAKRALDALYPLDRLRGNLCEPDGFDDLREAIQSVVTTRPGNRPDSVRLGGRLKSWRKRIIGDSFLDVTPTEDRTGAKVWRVVTK
jgi:putative DNA primase/helicase